MATHDAPAGRRQSPTTDGVQDGRETETTEDAQTSETSSDASESSDDGALDRLVREMVQSEMGEVREELDALERQVEEVENFAQISLNERKLKQTETNLSAFSDSLTAFAEKAFNNINELESRLDEQALLLAAILEALDREGIDVDTDEVKHQQADSLVATATPEERLAEALDAQ